MPVRHRRPIVEPEVNDGFTLARDPRGRRVPTVASHRQPSQETPHEDLPHRHHSRRRHRQGSRSRRPARCWRRWPRATARFALRVRELRLGRRLVPRARRDDAGRRPGRAARQGRDPVRLGRRPAHPRPHHAVGPAPEDLPGLRPVRQRAADAHPARHRRRRSSAAARRTSTGSSCARTPKASTPASAAACTRAIRSRPRPTCR